MVKIYINITTIFYIGIENITTKSTQPTGNEVVKLYILGIRRLVDFKNSADIEILHIFFLSFFCTLIWVYYVSMYTFMLYKLMLVYAYVHLLERESIQFDGQSYVDVDLADPLKSTTDNTVTMRFRTKFADGLLFAAYSRSDHMMIELYCGLVRMSIDLGGGKLAPFCLFI